MHLRNWVWAAGLCLSTVIAMGCSDSTDDAAEAAMPADAPVDAIGELTATLEEMGVRASAQAPPEPAIEEPQDVVFLGGRPPLTHEGVAPDVGSEIALLREHVHQLERSLNFYMDTVVTDLREENAYLRDELARIYATIPLEDRMRPIVPRPGSAVLNDVQDVAADPNYAAWVNETRLGPPVALELKIAKEWGRTPDEAAEMGGGVNSLKGMIGSVAPGASDEALMQFGRELREQFADHTNVNIVVFDNEAAASTYATRNAKSTTRHVLSISRHAPTGVDEIYIFRNGTVVETERF